MKTAPIVGFLHLHHPLVSHRMGVEQCISVMDKEDRRSAGPKSNQRPSGAMVRRAMGWKLVVVASLCWVGMGLAQAPAERGPASGLNRLALLADLATLAPQG